MRREMANNTVGNHTHKVWCSLFCPPPPPPPRRRRKLLFFFFFSVTEERVPWIAGSSEVGTTNTCKLKNLKEFEEVGDDEDVEAGAMTWWDGMGWDEKARGLRRGKEWDIINKLGVEWGGKRGKKISSNDLLAIAVAAEPALQKPTSPTTHVSTVKEGGVNHRVGLSTCY